MNKVDDWATMYFQFVIALLGICPPTKTKYMNKRIYNKKIFEYKSLQKNIFNI